MYISRTADHNEETIKGFENFDKYEETSIWEKVVCVKQAEKRKMEVCPVDLFFLKIENSPRSVSWKNP